MQGNPGKGFRDIRLMFARQSNAVELARKAREAEEEGLEEEFIRQIRSGLKKK